MKKISPTQDHWLRIDERFDVLSSLKIFNDLLHLSSLDEWNIKWLILSIHSALQGMIVFHLSVGNDFQVMRPKNMKNWLRAYESGSQYPKTQMDNFLNLFERIQKNDISSITFEPTARQKNSVKIINDYRNNFTHFMPQNWSIETSGLYNIFEDCLDIINLLGVENESRWEDADQYNHFRQLTSNAYAQINVDKK